MNKRKLNDSIRMWIDGKCFDIKKLQKPETSRRVQSELKNSTVKRQIDPPFSVKFHLPSIYYIKLDRFRNPHINQLETDTNTIISYPKYGKDGSIEISGDSEESIQEAREKLHSFIANIRQQLGASQFISIPLLSNEIKQNFEEFKNKILSENYPGVEESIFQSSLKLHLTIVVFTLLDNREKQEAIDVLEECKKQFLERKSESSTAFKIKVQGLNCMNDDLSKVNVLYANAALSDCDAGKSLQEIADSISNLFYERGLAREYQDHVKLHMTLMNTKYRNKKEGTPKKRWVNREPFDAKEVIEKYKDYYFGEAIFDTVHLSLMTAKGDDGFYKALATIKF